MRSTKHRPSNLNQKWYDGFDIWDEPDRRIYRIPHTLLQTAFELTSGPLAVIAFFLAACIAVTTQNLAPPKADLPTILLWIGIAYLPIHAAAALLAGTIALLLRRRTAITIAIDSGGLIYNDCVYYPANHLWKISYGSTSKRGTVAEEFTPRIEIQLGTQTLLLGENLDPVAAHLFMRLFQDDIRKYWHGHN